MSDKVKSAFWNEFDTRIQIGFIGLVGLLILIAGSVIIGFLPALLIILIVILAIILWKLKSLKRQ